MKNFTYCVVLLGTTVSVWLGAKFLVGQALAPVEMTITYSQAGAGSAISSVLSSTIELSIRGDGSKVETRLVTAPDGKRYEQKTVTDVRAQKEVTVDGITESLTTYAVSAEASKSLSNPGARCSSLVNPKPSSFLGHPVLIGTETFGDRLLESSFAPGLGCAMLRQSVSQKDMSGQYHVVSLKEALTVRTGPVEPARFAVPEWTERSPSAVIAEFERKFRLTSSNRDVYLQKDKAYYARQLK